MNDIADADPFLWLEEIEGTASLDWVRAENALTLKVLESDPRYESVLAEATHDLSRADRLPTIKLVGAMVYDLLQDADHVRGLLRRIPVDQFVSGADSWEPVLDIDALCKAESASWVYRGISVLAPERRLALVTLSPGGTDSTVIREFDLTAKSFVAGGFETTNCKVTATWLDHSSILVSAATRDADTTTSGYGRTVAHWKRGTPFDQRETVFQIAPNHMGADTTEYWDKDTRHLICSDRITIFDAALHYLSDDLKARKLPVPDTFSPVAIHDGSLVGSLRADLQQGENTVKAGTLVAFELAPMLATRRLPPAEVVFAPAPNQAFFAPLGTGAAASSCALYVTVLEDVSAKLKRITRTNDNWSVQDCPLPALGSVSVLAGNATIDGVFVKHQDFITPPSVYFVAEGASPRMTHSLKPRFDASGLTTVQHFATSSDGTQVPYFVTKPTDLKLDGHAPALIGAYGGFNLAITPAYMGAVGNGQPVKTMLTSGGIYVLANIRGGGEYGPDWHRAGLSTHRQRVFDDFHAVAEDLIRRGYTSAAKLGIVGGSNSGLLMGVCYTQRPDLYKAVLCGVPLLDMRRYHKMLAGASWMGEYGDPDDPEIWKAIGAYSPYHNLHADKKYPEVFFTGSTKDDRVHPGHMRKQAALMKQQGHSYLYYEATEGGHSGGADLTQSAKLQALQTVYLLRKLF